MKNKLIIITALFIGIGCTSQTNLATIKYHPHNSMPKYYLDVPSNYSFKGNGISREIENKFIYNDSSFIYITNFKNTPNYNNIFNLGDSIAQIRFQNALLSTEINKLMDSVIITPIPHTIELSGIQKDGLYWKDVKNGDISIGYVNVQLKNKEIYDNAINSFRTK